jgi:threonine dehydrogenase-like Zn-dependent dehydrogenase
LYGVGLPGGMATHVVVPAYCLYRLPASVDYELGALAEPLAVTVHALRLANVGPDSTVLVLGAGTIGQMTIAAARHLGGAGRPVACRFSAVIQRLWWPAALPLTIALACGQELPGDFHNR